MKYRIIYAGGEVGNWHEWGDVLSVIRAAKRGGHAYYAPIGVEGKR